MTTTQTAAADKAKPEMFPKAKASLDMLELGARMAARKEDLLAQAD